MSWRMNELVTVWRKKRSRMWSRCGLVCATRSHWPDESHLTQGSYSPCCSRYDSLEMKGCARATKNQRQHLVERERTRRTVTTSVSSDSSVEVGEPEAAALAAICDWPSTCTSVCGYSATGMAAPEGTGGGGGVLRVRFESWLSARRSSRSQS